MQRKIGIDIHRLDNRIRRCVQHTATQHEMEAVSGTNGPHHPLFERAYGPGHLSEGSGKRVRHHPLHRVARPAADGAKGTGGTAKRASGCPAEKAGADGAFPQAGAGDVPNRHDHRHPAVAGFFARRGTDALRLSGPHVPKSGVAALADRFKTRRVSNGKTPDEKHSGV